MSDFGRKRVCMGDIDIGWSRRGTHLLLSATWQPANEGLITQLGPAGLPHICAGGNPDSNTLISEMTTVLCLDDFHSLDRSGRSREKVTALDPKAQNFALMKEQVRWDKRCPCTHALLEVSSTKSHVDVQYMLDCQGEQAAETPLCCVPVLVLCLHHQVCAVCSTSAG